MCTVFTQLFHLPVWQHRGRVCCGRNGLRLSLDGPAFLSGRGGWLTRPPRGQSHTSVWLHNLWLLWKKEWWSKLWNLPKKTARPAIALSASFLWKQAWWWMIWSGHTWYIGNIKIYRVVGQSMSHLMLGGFFIGCHCLAEPGQQKPTARNQM